MAVALDDFQAFIAGGVAGSVVNINRQPDAPDACVTIMATGGLPQTFEGAFEGQHFMIRSRDVTDEAAEALAKAVHEFLSANQSSQQIGSSYVLCLEPQAPPSYFSRDVDNRTTYSATYLVTSAT